VRRALPNQALKGIGPGPMGPTTFAARFFYMENMSFYRPQLADATKIYQLL
jgi:hypothetical protein